jgi:hypothetical protein
MMRSDKRSTMGVVTIAIILAMALSGCARDETVAPTVTAAALEPYAAEETANEFSGIAYDYDPVESPAALADLSSLIVTGTIDRVQEGRVRTFPASEDLAGISTIVLVLRDVKVERGQLEEGNDGFVYVELPNPGGQKPEAYQDGLRADSSVVAYLLPAPDGAPIEGVDSVIADSKAGRPDGQALYQTANPQAFILQYNDDAVVWPLIGEQKEGHIEDALPAGKLTAF